MSIATDDVTAETLKAVNRFNEAFNRHDVDEIMARMTEDCVFESTSPPDGERFEGQAAVRACWESFFQSSPNAYFEGLDIIPAGDRCTVPWLYRWTREDGTQGHIRGVDVLRVRDGKIAEKLAFVKG